MSEETKIEWFRMSTLEPGKGEITFTVLDPVGKEKFSLWDNQRKTFLGEGFKINTTQGELEVNKFIALKKLTEEEQKRYSRKLQFVRRVILDGKQIMLPLPKTAEVALNGVMETVKTMDKNPLRFTYKLSRYKPDDGGFMKYNVRLGEEVSKEQMEALIGLNEKEKALIKKMREDKDIMENSIEYKEKVMTTNEISNERAKDLVMVVL